MQAERRRRPCPELSLEQRHPSTGFLQGPGTCLPRGSAAAGSATVPNVASHSRFSSLTTPHGPQGATQAPRHEAAEGAEPAFWGPFPSVTASDARSPGAADCPRHCSCLWVFAPRCPLYRAHSPPPSPPLFALMTGRLLFPLPPVMTVIFIPTDQSKLFSFLSHYKDEQSLKTT